MSNWHQFHICVLQEIRKFILKKVFPEENKSLETLEFPTKKNPVSEN